MAMVNISGFVLTETPELFLHMSFLVAWFLHGVVGM